MHHPTDRIAHTTAFVTPVVKHWLKREIAQWVHHMKDRSDDPSHHERRPLPRGYISLPSDKKFCLQTKADFIFRIQIERFATIFHKCWLVKAAWILRAGGIASGLLWERKIKKTIGRLVFLILTPPSNKHIFLIVDIVVDVVVVVCCLFFVVFV